MDDGLKQRIIGAIVLFALAVIFIPIVFDRERIEPVSKKSQIPVAPHIETITIDAPKKIEIKNPAKSRKDIFVPDENQPVEVVDIEEPTQEEQSKEISSAKAASKAMTSKEKAAKEKALQPSLSDKTTPNAWVLQIASFLHDKHAKDLRDKLLKQGYAAYIRDVETSKGNRKRVFIGPKIDKKRILADKKKIEKEFKVESLLLKFEP